MRIFYCWQSDRPRERNLIEDALERAVRNVVAGDELKLEPVVDRDTRGLPGAPEISQSIFEKIRDAGAVVADLTITHADTERRYCNSNVLVETGYALASIGADRVILVMNTAHGDPSDLPFDLRGRRVLTYRLA